MKSITNKIDTLRKATASSVVLAAAQTIERLKSNDVPKKDILIIARAAGVMAAKKTPELIPMCHPILLSNIDVDLTVCPPKEKDTAEIEIKATVSAAGQTGVEMEAMTAVSVAALTIYDMCKAVDKGISFGEIGLAFKSGGKSGIYKRS